MITIACTNCKTELTMDEAFAGGVCRCQHCGTIQTVPSQLKKGAVAGAPAGQAVGASKPLYQQSRTPTDAASGLEALGDAVTSSGLGSARLKSPRLTPPGGASVDNAAVATPAKNPLLLPLIIAVGVLVLVVIGLVIYFVTRSGSSSSNENAGNGATPGQIVVPAGASFMGASIKGSNIVYIIDRGNAASGYFDGMKGALLKSLHSLGEEKSFRVLLPNEDAPIAIPSAGMLEATDANIQEVQDSLRDAVASGASSLTGDLNSAVALKPDSIIVATAKVNLDDDELAALQRASKSGVRLYLFSIGNDMLAEPFQAAAGDRYHSISSDQLTQLAQ